MLWCYEMLSEIFNFLESSTHLLRMKGSKATFPNICASIQNLAERSIGCVRGLTSRYFKVHKTGCGLSGCTVVYLEEEQAPEWGYRATVK